MSAPVVAFLVGGGRDPEVLVPHTPEDAAKLAQHGLPTFALVRQNDHIAALSAARREALMEAAAAVCLEVTHLERHLDDLHQAKGARRAHEAILRLSRGEGP